MLQSGWLVGCFGLICDSILACIELFPRGTEKEKDMIIDYV